MFRLSERETFSTCCTLYVVYSRFFISVSSSNGGDDKFYTSVDMDNPA